MFSNATKKSYAPKLQGEVKADFYDAEYYLGGNKSNWDNPYDWKDFAKLFKDWAIFLITGFPEAKSFINVGCARGFLEKAVIEIVEHNERNDIEIEGFDLSPWAIENAEPEAKPFVSVASVDDYRFTKKYDVMVSLDTFEHLTETQAMNFLLRSRKFIRDCGFFVIALDEERQQGEPSHVNLKDRAWWDAKFAECGWISDWETKMMTALVMREKFIKVCKVEVFIFRAQAENGRLIETPHDEGLLELARLERWKIPEGKNNAT